MVWNVDHAVQKKKIDRLTERRGPTQKAAVLEAVKRELVENGSRETQSGSALD